MRKQYFLPFLSCFFTLALTAQEIRTSGETKLSEIQAVSELNHDGIAECYPFISADGLRLYYTISTDHLDRIVYTERKSLDGPFGEYTMLSINPSDVDAMSCWLSPDELEIYFMVRRTTYGASTTLMKANRSIRNESFGEPVAINLIGDLDDNLFAPSITPDGNELFVYCSSMKTLRFEKTGALEYTLRETLDGPDGKNPKPGQLSKDGLRYYLSLESNERNSSEMGYYSRKKAGDPFTEYTPIKSEELSLAGQPSEALGGKILFLKTSSENLWSENDLNEAFLPETVTPPATVEQPASAQAAAPGIPAEEFLPPVTEEIVIYPNPAMDFLHLKGIGENATVYVYDMQGKLVIEDRVQANRILIQALTPGTYQMCIQDGTAVSTHLFVKQ